MRTIYCGVHLLGPRLSRSLDLSRVCHNHQRSRIEHFSHCMFQTPFWKDAFRIDSRLGCFLPPFETVLSCKWMLSSARIYFDASPMLAPNSMDTGRLTPSLFVPPLFRLLHRWFPGVGSLFVSSWTNWKSSNFRAFSFLDTGSSWFQPIHASKNSWLFSMMQFIRYTS